MRKLRERQQKRKLLEKKVLILKSNLQSYFPLVSLQPLSIWFGENFTKLSALIADHHESSKISLISVIPQLKEN